MTSLPCKNCVVYFRLAFPNFIILAVPPPGEGAVSEQPILANSFYGKPIQLTIQDRNDPLQFISDIYHEMTDITWIGYLLVPGN